MSFPSIRFPVAVEPSSRIPHWLAEITFSAAEVVPPDRVAESSLDQDPFVGSCLRRPSLTCRCRSGCPRSGFWSTLSRRSPFRPGCPKSPAGPGCRLRSYHSDALSICTPSSALPRSAVPVESVPIRLSRTTTPVAEAPEIKNADQVGRDDIARADQRARRVIGNAGAVIAKDGGASGVKPDDVVDDRVAGASASGDVNAGSLV